MGGERVVKIISRESVADEPRWRVYNKIAFRIMPLLLIAYTFASIDRVNVAFAKLTMGVDLGLTEAMYGFGAGVFFIGYCLFEIPSNMIMHKVGARWWLARILVVWGLLSACTMFVRTPNEFYAIRFVLGVAEAGFYPGAMLYMTYWFPSYLRSQALAVMIAGKILNAIIGAPISGAIMRFMDGQHDLAGWQWLFVIEGLPASVLGVVFFFILRNGPADAKWLTADEKKLVLNDLETEKAAQAAAGIGHRFSDAFRNVSLWCVVVANFAQLSTQYGMQFWIPTIIRQATGATVFQTGFIQSGLALIPCIVLFVNAAHTDKTRERRWHATAGFAVTFVGLITAGIFTEINGYVALAGLVMANAGQVMVSSTIFSLPATFVMGAGAAAGFALITTVGNTAGYTTPFLFGVLKDFTGAFTAGFYGMAAVAVLGGCAILLTPALRKKAPIAPAEVAPAEVQ
jgi:MFS family permease